MEINGPRDSQPAKTLSVRLKSEKKEPGTPKAKRWHILDINSTQSWTAHLDAWCLQQEASTALSPAAQCPMTHAVGGGDQPKIHWTGPAQDDVSLAFLLLGTTRAVLPAWPRPCAT